MSNAKKSCQRYRAPANIQSSGNTGCFQLLQDADRMSRQNILLRRLTGATVGDLGDALNELETYKTTLDAFDDVHKQQIEQMRATVGERARTLTSEAERLFALWTQFRPSGDVLAVEGDQLSTDVEFIRSSQEKFAALAEQYDALRLDFISV